MITQKRSFTMMELLIVIAIIAILATVAILLLNPWAQIGKAWDAKRKRDLDTLRKVLEDYYNDKGCYPKPEEICYDSPTRICKLGNLISQTCHICGQEPTSPSFKPYLEILPCDPQHNKKKYLYEIQPKPGITCDYVGDPTNDCPQWYRVYSKLSIEDDPVIKQVDCQANSCGVPPTYGNNYGVASPNEKLNRTSAYYCYDIANVCKNCGGSYTTCDNNPSCQIVYGSQNACCTSHVPKPIGCP